MGVSSKTLRSTLNSIKSGSKGSSCKRSIDSRSKGSMSKSHDDAMTHASKMSHTYEEFIGRLRDKITLRDVENKQLKEELLEAETRHKVLADDLAKEVEAALSEITASAKLGTLGSKAEQVTRRLGDLLQFKIQTKKREAEMISRANKETRKRQKLAEENKILQA